MMYKFKAKASADVIMLAPAGDQMLTTIGMEPASKGIIQASQMLAAIRAIEQAIAAEETAGRHSEDTAATEGRNPPSDEGVSLRQRSWPLLEMLRQASREGHAIVWGV